MVEHILRDVSKVLEKQRKLDAGNYTDTDVFKGLNEEMMETVKFGRSKLRCIIDGAADRQTSMQWPLRTCQRMVVAMRRKQLRYSSNSKKLAHELCQLIGLVRSSVNETNEIGESRLIQAAADDASPSALRLLMKAGASLNAATPEGFTAVFRAAQYGNADCLKVLINSRADTNLGHKNGATPLFVAAQNQHPVCLRMLINARVSIDAACNDGSTPLLIASQSGHQDCVDLLLKAGANVNLTKKDGVAPIFSAARHCNLECIQLLKAAGADLNVRFKGMTPLDAARLNDGHRVRACVATLESYDSASFVSGSKGETGKRSGNHRVRGRGPGTSSDQALEPLPTADTRRAGTAGHHVQGRGAGTVADQASEPLAASGTRRAGTARHRVRGGGAGTASEQASPPPT
jgi:ankyrin repeat protein